jgi:hypothetical protein
MNALLDMRGEREPPDYQPDDEPHGRTGDQPDCRICGLPDRRNPLHDTDD